MDGLEEKLRIGDIKNHHRRNLSNLIKSSEFFFLAICFLIFFTLSFSIPISWPPSHVIYHNFSIILTTHV